MSKCVIQRREVADGKLTLQSSLLDRIYRARGVVKDQDLDRSLKHLLPFELLDNVEEAAQCMLRHIFQDHSIVVVGDFDTDGATSVATVVGACRPLV